MVKTRKIQCYDYVNHPYEKVRDALTDDAVAVFQAATRVASSRVESVAAELNVQIAGLKVGADIAIDVSRTEERPPKGGSHPSTSLTLEWQAARSPGLFPVMKGELCIYPLTATETQLDFLGQYEPPMGFLGGAIDAVVGHRIAQASVHRFVNEIAEHLRRTLEAPTR